MAIRYKPYIKAVAISLVFFFGMWLNQYVNRFRGIPDYRWIYNAGKDLSMFLFFLMPIVGIIYAVFTFRITTLSKRSKYFLLVIALVPLLILLYLMGNAFSTPID